MVDQRAWRKEIVRRARRLGRHRHGPAKRAAAWRTGRITMMVHVPNDAATGRPLSDGARVQPVRATERRTPAIAHVDHGRALRGRPDVPAVAAHQAVRIRFARHRPVERQLTVSPHDGRGGVAAVARLRLSPRH